MYIESICCNYLIQMLNLKSIQVMCHLTQVASKDNLLLPFWRHRSTAEVLAGCPYRPASLFSSVSPSITVTSMARVKANLRSRIIFQRKHLKLVLSSKSGFHLQKKIWYGWSTEESNFVTKAWSWAEEDLWHKDFTPPSPVVLPPHPT